MLPLLLRRVRCCAQPPATHLSLPQSLASVRRLLHSNSGEAPPPYIGVQTEFTDRLEMASTRAALGTYQVLTLDGELRRSDYTPALPLPDIVRIYQGMRTLRVVDSILHDVQRHGRISFYMSSTGEEALQFASAAALDADDVVFAQYREPGVLMWRGFTIEQMAAQCFGNKDDLGKGRQMPVHYGSAALRFHTISSPLSTQMPQASGAAYALKRAGAANIAVCYFGDGAASEGDFHAALNFASARNCPVLFFCRNNGYAISTPSGEQSAGNGIAPRGRGYGIAALRVDGNDVLAVLDATLAARRHALRQSQLRTAPQSELRTASQSQSAPRTASQSELRTASQSELLTASQSELRTASQSELFTAPAQSESAECVNDGGAECEGEAPPSPAPVLLEAMTYRGAHHSTSDDSTRYRAPDEMQRWARTNCPLRRARTFLERAGVWSEALERELVEHVRQRTVDAVRRAERTRLPPLDALFEDVYAELPPELQRQRAALHRHLKLYPQEYHLERHHQQQ